MFKKMIFFFIFIFLPCFVFAQIQENLITEPNLDTSFEQAVEAVEIQDIPPEIQAEAGPDKIEEINTKVTFDASQSKIDPENLKVEYLWNFGDGSLGQGSNIIHSYEASGEYRAVLTIRDLNNPELKSENFLNVSVYEDLIVLITDKEEEKSEDLRRIISRAKKDGILMIIFRPDTGEKNDFSRSEKLVRSMLENKDALEKAQLIFGWTEANEDLHALIKLGQELKDSKDLNFKKKNIVIVREDKFNLISNLTQAVFDSLSPVNVILTQDTAFNPLLVAASKPERAVSAVQASGAKYKIFGIYSQRVARELKPTNFLSFIINFMINKAVPIETILLVLMLPIVAALIALMRQVIGIETFGIYTPTIVALSFVATGLKYGLAVFLLILIVGTLGRLILKKARLLHTPKLAIVIVFVSMAILAMLAEGSVSSRTGLISISIFPMLIMMILVEKFVNVQVEKGIKTAIKISIETLLISILCYFIVTWQTLRNALLTYPEIIFGTIVINFILGKWTGLTLREYWRFREVVKAIRRKK